jgi:hypothetical protein
VLRFLEREVSVGWDQLCQQAPEATTAAWDQVTADPRRTSERQHRLRGSLAKHHHKGQDLPVWQYEVTSGGRLWYLIDDRSDTLWLFHAGTGHPKATD